MRQSLIDLMAMIMPLLMPLVWLGGALLVIGTSFLLARLVSSSSVVRAGVAWAGILLIALGGFFLACQVAGLLLGAAPAINIGDAARYEFYLIPFWLVGFAMLIPGLLFYALRGRRG